MLGCWGLTRAALKYRATSGSDYAHYLGVEVSTILESSITTDSSVLRLGPFILYLALYELGLKHSKASERVLALALGCWQCYLHKLDPSLDGTPRGQRLDEGSVLFGDRNHDDVPLLPGPLVR